MSLKKSQGQSHQKSALADKKTHDPKSQRKTSFLIPMNHESSEADEEESSDYVSDFPDFKKNKAIIDLKKRKLSQGKQGSCEINVNEMTTTTTLKTNVNNRINLNEDIHTNSKYRPSTPKVFNYFSVPRESFDRKTKSFSQSSIGFSSNSNFNYIDQTKLLIEKRLPKINSAIKENLLSNRLTSNKNLTNKNEKLYKNLFFPLLINNGNNNLKKSDHLVTKITNYFDDPNGVFFLQSLSHLSMKNVNQI